MDPTVAKFYYRSFEIIYTVFRAPKEKIYNGHYVISSGNVEIERFILDPPVVSKAEARNKLIDRSKLSIDSWIGRGGKIIWYNGAIEINGTPQKLVNGSWAVRCTITEHRGAETIDHVLFTGGEMRDDRHEAEVVGLTVGIHWFQQKFPDL
ncbi:MAG: hypothetical protein ACKOXL_06060 [Limnohabitans sp.]